MKSSELIKLLKRDGWYVVRQSGSHIMMAHELKKNQLVVPFHSSKEVKKGLLSAILKIRRYKDE